MIATINRIARALVFAGLGIAPCAIGTTGRAEITIAEGGASPYRIVVPADAIPSERYAAEELQGYLKKITGARLPIVTADKPGDDDREIAVGLGAVPEADRAGIDIKALGTDGFRLLNDGDRVVIAGGRPRGTLYGVYSLLEDKLGVRWFAPEWNRCRNRIAWSCRDLDETHVPALEYREVFWSEMLHDADFAARQRLNGDHYPLTEKHGGRAVVYYPFVHSFDMLVPPNLYEEHPEYFPLIDGTRKNGYVQRCLSNPDVVRIATEAVLRGSRSTRR